MRVSELMKKHDEVFELRDEDYLFYLDPDKKIMGGKFKLSARHRRML